MTTPAGAETVSKTLQRSLHEARLHRIPKHPARRAIVLACISSFLERRHPYSERALNELLSQVLTQFAADVDHVTCRRYLVDLGFLKRDRAGQRYYLNFPKLESTLDEDARGRVAELMQAALSAARDKRPRTRFNQLDAGLNLKEGSAKLRRYQPTDAAPLAQLFFAAVHEGTVGHYSRAERKAWAPEPPESTAWHTRLAAQESWVAENHSGLLGFMTLTPEGYLDLAYVRPDQRGRGVAGHLYRHIEKLALARGLNRMTSDASHLARRFLERRGWQLLATRQRERFGVTLINHHMTKELGGGQPG